MASRPAGHASFYLAQAAGWFSGLQVHFTDSCLIFHLTICPSPFLQGCSQSLHSPTVLILGAAPNHVWDLAIGLASEINEVCLYSLLKPMKA